MSPWRLCYDEKNEQLIVGGQDCGHAEQVGLHVYTFTMEHLNRSGLEIFAQHKQKSRKEDIKITNIVLQRSKGTNIDYRRKSH